MSENIDEYKKLVDSMANYYNHEINDDQFDMYVHDYSKYPLGVIRKAFHEYRIESPSNFFPLPCVIISRIENPRVDMDQVHVGMEKILSSLRRFGSYSPNQAKEFLGEDLWSCVERMGGWKTLCLSDIGSIQWTRTSLERIIKVKLERKRKEENFNLLIEEQDKKQIGEGNG